MAKKEIFYTPKAPLPKGPYSQAVIHNGILYISGQGPVDPKNGNIVRGTIEEETRTTLNNIKTIVEEAGFGMEDVIKVNCFLSDMNDFEKFNKVYAEFFLKDPPARSTLQAGRLPVDIKVEIDAIVAKRQP